MKGKKTEIAGPESDNPENTHLEMNRDDSILQKDDLIVNLESDDDSVICLDESDLNPYFCVPRALAIDNTISLQCRGFLITVLMYLSDGIKINIKNINQECLMMDNIGKTHSLIDEAVKSGYLKLDNKGWILCLKKI